MLAQMDIQGAKDLEDCISVVLFLGTAGHGAARTGDGATVNGAVAVQTEARSWSPAPA